jgi:uncharacterized protein (DUF58 family)
VTVTGRAVALAAAGVVPVLLAPAAATVLAWAAVVVVLCALDLALAASTAQVRLERDAPGAARLGESATSTLVLTNDGRRTLRGVVRDAWQPSAGAVDNRHAVTLAPGESTG